MEGKNNFTGVNKRKLHIIKCINKVRNLINSLFYFRVYHSNF